jgi:hypothetical protein
VSGDLEGLPDTQRLLDLVRYQRRALHDAKLISDKEYVALVNVGSAAARRLESYDQVRERLRNAEETAAHWRTSDEAWVSVAGRAMAALGRPDSGDLLGVAEATAALLAECRALLERPRHSLAGMGCPECDQWERDRKSILERLPKGAV